MDIFNRKRVRELEEKLAKAEESRDKYIGQAARLDVIFQEMEELKETIPEDCVRGPWCEACEFVKRYYYTEHYGLGSHYTRTAYVCGKGKSCNNFVQKKYEED
jgi:hypothetical protein